MQSIKLTVILTAIIIISSMNASAAPHHPHSKPRAYKAQKTKILTTLPTGYTFIRFQGAPYYIHAGVFYQPYQGHFRVATAPVGISVNLLPTNRKVIRVKQNRYFVSNGVYYKKAGKRFVVIRRPV